MIEDLTRHLGDVVFVWHDPLETADVISTSSFERRVGDDILCCGGG